MPRTRLPPPPASSSSRCPKCRRPNASSLDHGSSLELGLDETPSCSNQCCLSCGFVFADDAIVGGNLRSRSTYGSGFSQFDSIVEIAGNFGGDAAATGNWVSEDGMAAASSCRPAAGARYRGNATRYALPRPRHAAAFAKLAGLCGKVSAPRAVAEAAKAMLRAVLSESSSSKAKASTTTTTTTTTSSSAASPPPPPALPHALLGGACLLLAARRERAPLFPADVAAALAVEPLRLARAAAAAAEAARASEGSAAPVGAEAFLRRELPGLLRGSSGCATNGGSSGAKAGNGAAAAAAAAEPAATAIAQTLEDASTLVRWVDAGACPVKVPAHGPTLAAGASLLAAASRGVRLLGDGDGGLAAVAAAFRLASASDAARCEEALRKGLCRLAAARVPWLRKIRARDVERHARALLAAAREAAAEAEAEEAEQRRTRQEEREKARLRAAGAAANGEGGEDDAAALASSAVGPSSKEAPRERGEQNDGEEEEEEEEEEEDELDVIREEEWVHFIRRPEEVALAAVELAAREKREAEAEAEAEERGERSGVATPVQRPRKRPCAL